MVIGTVGAVALGPLVTAMDKLKDTLRETIDFADRAQKASLALGLTYEDTKNSLGGTMEGLRGDINQRFAAGIAGMEAGLQGNTAGVAKLINQQMLTGTAYRQTAKAFANLEVGMNLSRDETNVLAASLVDTGNKYEISTDKLVGVINSLKETFPAQKLAGMGKDMMAAVVRLQGELGPALQGPLTKVMNMIFDTSEQGMLTMAKLGAPHARERLSAADGVTAKFNLLKDVVGVGSNTVKKFATGSDKLFRKLGVTTEVLGKSVLHLTTLTDAMGDRLVRSGWDQFVVDFGLTLNNLKKEMLVPFQLGLTKLHPILLKVMDTISGITNIIGEKFQTWIEGLGDGSEAIKNFQLAVIDITIFSLGKFRGAFAVMGEIFTVGLPWVFNRLQSVIYDITRPGGTITGLQYAFHTVTAALFSFSEYLNMGGDREKEIEKQIVIYQKLADISGKLMDDTIWLQKPITGPPSMLGGYQNFDTKDVVTFKGVLNTFENRQKELAGKGGSTNPLGLMIEKAADTFAGATKNDPQIKALNEARESIVAGNGFARKTNSLLEEAQARLQAIDDKTPDITAPAFLDETANMLGRSIEGILGVGRDTTAEEILEELRAANEQRAAAAIDAAVVQMGGNPANTR